MMITEYSVEDIDVMYKEEKIDTISRKVFSVRNTLLVLYHCRAYKVLHRPPKGVCISLHNEFKLK